MSYLKTTLARLSIYLTIAFIFFSCGTTEKITSDKWKTIQVGNYLFDFPSNYKLMKENGVDSYVGAVKGDNMLFIFDFGYYSNELQETPPEYLENGEWKSLLPFLFMENKKTYDNTNTPKVDVLSIRPATSEDSIIGNGCEYVAKCSHDRQEFDYPIYIPRKLKSMNYLIDTVNNQFRKIIWSQNPEKGITGIHIKDLTNFSESINSYLALTMTTGQLTIDQQETALKILKTGRLKTH